MTRVKVLHCKTCNSILRKLTYSIAGIKLKSGYTKPKSIKTNHYLCTVCSKTFNLNEMIGGI